MVKFIASILLSLVLLSPTMAAPVEGTCPDGTSTYEQGFETFKKSAEELNGSFVSDVAFDDGSFVSIWDFRSNPDVDPATPFFVLVFDPIHCYVTSVWFSQQQVQDAFGIVLAAN